MNCFFLILFILNFRTETNTAIIMPPDYRMSPLDSMGHFSSDDSSSIKNLFPDIRHASSWDLSHITPSTSSGLGAGWRIPYKLIREGFK